MSGNRGEFSSKLGFIMAAAGSAIGLGNIWGFPGQAAQNGGAAFVVVYIVLSFIIAYPAFMAELIIGRHSRSNIVGAFTKIEGGKNFQFVGYAGIICASLILSFYTIIAGWMLSYVFSALFSALGAAELAAWSIDPNSTSRTVVFAIVFAFLTMSVIAGGVKDGIEKWSTKLMPILLTFLVALAIYVLMQDGASEGLAVYLLPDFSKVFEGQLVLSALGQAFFSLSLGVGTMLVYGSYIRKEENLPSIGALVTLADVGIAFLAGLLIIPAMYVAKSNGVEIFAADGSLIAGPNVAFQVLPGLFTSLGVIGSILGLIFFSLMTIAALTSSISMLEVPVSHAVDDRGMNRTKASYFIGGTILLFSIVLANNMGDLFGWVIALSTQYMEPVIGLLLCVFIGYVMNRNSVIEELKQGHPDIENSLFIKIWPFFVKVVCPLLILIVFIQSL